MKASHGTPYSDDAIRAVLAEAAEVIACPATRREVTEDPFLGGEFVQALAMMVIAERSRNTHAQEALRLLLDEVDGLDPHPDGINFATLDFARAYFSEGADEP